VAGEVGVRFDANISPALPWRFEPVQDRVRIQPGARTQVYYRATNLTARATIGTAVFNVTPAAAGKYFSKMECFCFSEQTLKGGQSVDMPVIFYVDPKIREDEDTRHIDEITLSYTFYPVESAAKAR
jgi:cytochrome c oxidase assembly protein subunit 11